MDAGIGATIGPPAGSCVMNAQALPVFEQLQLSRAGRVLSLVLHRPDKLNAFGRVMHAELVDALQFAARDEHADVIVLTGSGSAFSAGGDIESMEQVARDPALFDREAADAKRIVLTLLDMDKPVIAKVNGHAVGLGATLALLCDVIFMAENAKIGDPHVKVGLVAGDGGAFIWPQLIGYARAKELLFTGDLLSAARAAEMGLINHAVPAALLDQTVQTFCDRLTRGAMQAIRGTKATVNLELRRMALAALDAGLALESLSVRSADHREAVRAFREKRAPRFGSPQ